MVLKPPSDWTMVPAASATPGCFCEQVHQVLPCVGAEESEMADEPGGRTKMSAPMPRARRALASSVP